MPTDDDPRSPVRRLWGWVRELPTVWKVAAGLVATATVGVAGLYMYRTYQFVEHDNQFCLSCHLMQDPYERFAQSAHRDLSCKACHRPTFMARSQMALEQFVAQPDTLATHAEVPNERCAECHIEGNPEKWRVIEQTAGHRVHFESDDPELSGLQCVECHSTTVHQFAPTNRTCGQAGCHEDVEVRLGDMADLTIHCVACHQFAEPAPDAREAAAAEDGTGPLSPGREDCLSCHAMRKMMADLPADEPHDARCGVCHNPHEQEEPGDAVATCTDSGCHTQVDTVSDFHHQRPTIRLVNCTQCHGAHAFRVDGENCLGCHRDILRDDRRVSARTPASNPPASGGTAPAAGYGDGFRPTAGRRPPRTAAAGGPRAPAFSAASGPDGRSASRVDAEIPGARAPIPATQARGDTTRFRHGDHRDLECRDCHEKEQARIPTDPSWCRDCHHTGSGSRSCGSCHRPEELAGAPLEARRTLRFSTSEAGADRTLPFRHEAHRDVECAECHTGRPALSASGVSCAECHEEHHRSDSDCVACHEPAREDAHPREAAHLTCGGAGCHTESPFAEAPRFRSACLTCHRDLSDHRPGRPCVDCHVLPAPGPREGAG